MTIISITTDFGNLNGFTGTMKGVIYRIAPDAKIADITHEIPAQDVRTGAIALWRAAPYFPPNSVHIAVVDPGVGTARRPIAAKLGDQFFVLPDNGLITPMLEDAEAAKRNKHCPPRQTRILAPLGLHYLSRQGYLCALRCPSGSWRSPRSNGHNH